MNLLSPVDKTNPVRLQIRTDRTFCVVKNTYKTRSHQMSVKCGVETRKKGLITWRTVRRSGVRQQNVLSSQGHIKSETRALSLMLYTWPNPICVEDYIRKTVVTLVVGRVRKDDFVRRFPFISCVQVNLFIPSSYGYPQFLCLWVDVSLHERYLSCLKKREGFQQMPSRDMRCVLPVSSFRFLFL